MSLPPPDSKEAIRLHSAIAKAIHWGFLFVFMQSTRPTVLPITTPKRIMFWARAVHLGTYLSLALVAITGLWIGGFYWLGTKSGVVMDVALVLHLECDGAVLERA